MTFTLDLVQLLELFAVACGIAVVWGTLRAEVRSLRKDHDTLRLDLSRSLIDTKAEIDNLRIDLKQVPTLVERVTQFERHMGERIDSLTRSIEDIRSLLFRAATNTVANR